jgi:hypothetical protein
LWFAFGDLPSAISAALRFRFAPVVSFHLAGEFGENGEWGSAILPPAPVRLTA